MTKIHVGGGWVSLGNLLYRWPDAPDFRALGRYVFAALAGLALGLASVAAAGQAAVSPAPQDAASISTTVNEVSVDLSVHDKKHNAVLDLKPEDVAVTDDGVAVKLTGLHLVTETPGVSKGHLITMVFDSFHGAIAKSVQVTADKILAALPDNGYQFAVLDFKNRLRLMQNFTADRKVVDEAIHVVTESRAIVSTSTSTPTVTIMDDQAAENDRTKASSDAEKNMVAMAQTGMDASGTHVDVKTRALAQTLLNALNESQSLVQGQHARLSLAGLLALTKSQGGLADRKALIYFTQNRQLNPAEKKMLETITGAATKAGILVYTVDMDSVSASWQTDEANAHLNGATAASGAAAEANSSGIQGSGVAGPGSTGPSWGQQQDIQMITDFTRGSGEDRSNPFNDTKNPMAGFSKATGGAYIDAQGSTKRPIQLMVQDLTTYYQATYVPPFTDYDGKFRTIAVKPLRAGLDVEAKTGYFALAPGAEGGAQPFEAPLLKMLAEAKLPTDLKFRATVIRFGDLPDGNTNTLAVEVPYSELTTKLDARTNLSFARVFVVAQIKDQTGEVVEHFAQDASKLGVLETLARDPAAAISVERHFFSTPGKYTMEVAVLDQGGNKAGAVRRDFEIPAVTDGVSLSDMVLVRSLAEAHDEAADPLEPLRYEHQNVSPNLQGDLPGDAGEVAWFFMLHPDAASNQPMSLEMELIQNGKPGKRASLLQADGLHAATPYLARIKTKALAQGDYQVKAYLSQGGKTTEQSASFHVTASHATQQVASGKNASSDAEIEAGDGDTTTDSPAPAANRLPITAPDKAVAAPAQDEAARLIEAARDHALGYEDSLPKFSCTEVTRRSIDKNGNGHWKLRDTVVESLSFQDKREEHTTLEVNGSPSSKDRQELKGTFSSGEFGGVLQAVFRQASKADFKWKETDQLSGHEVQVYDYHVDRANSSFAVTATTGKQQVVGFHGQVFIEGETRRPRRITLVADLPAEFPTHATSIGVDYDYVLLSGLRYLMPVSAELRLEQGNHEALVNTMEFRDYKRFAASETGASQ